MSGKLHHSQRRRSRQKFYELLFLIISKLGRRFGGIPPRRVTHWIANQAYECSDYLNHKTRWVRDRWGSELLLNPYFHIDRHIVAFGCYDLPLHRFLNRYISPGMICFDVGANIGTVSIHMGNSTGKKGRIYCIEPVPNIYEQLVTNIERNEQQTICLPYQIALSDTTGFTTIGVVSVSTQNQGLGSLVNLDHPELDYRIEIQTTTIDEFIHEKGIDHVDIMKVDIQGGEILLLKGGTKCFSSKGAPDLLMEVSPTDLRSLGLSSKDELRLLEDYGYAIYEVTSRGQIGRQIFADSIASDFAASNVFCSKRQINEEWSQSSQLKV